MLQKINEWIDQTIAAFSNQKQSCAKFTSEFSGFFSNEFLSNCYFVIVNEIPKPNFPELYQAGLGDFINMKMAGITYKNTYFIRSSSANDRSIHFHELVHVLQWEILGAEGFIQRYITEIQNYGYTSAPIEIMAYALQNHFVNNHTPINILEYVQQKL